ncbi:carbohydrate ABC transporter substrate-binding protein, CUT1 family (TC 3.A.1.1.-) [Streptomyces sp. WMMB 714]|uniref:ABC transporter substrate-binding protein n=1 Tax=Streptomyces sp. WMMB 714 TaxID=1286822 RepID=UPI0005F7CF9D|nr:sugar ABC transporter substrate-binding protein [Streptomyces sp. WMMB 714]SCK38200.1 carbohydrate ABC transporter substrate-binding protein, CUT1 family (TC 3.A.1.1.-) [Streptomyces sp. WMMB 714]
MSTALRGNRRRTSARACAASFAALALAVPAAGCAPQTGSAGDGSTVSYWMWDAAQQPAYEACAKAFHKKNPGLRVKITQIGWDSYWTKLTSSFIAGTEPDVFTNHVAHYPQYEKIGVLSPLDELGPTRGIKASDYEPGLAEPWMGRDGHRYGAPKDWDTVGLFYDKKVTRAAGVSDAELRDMDWNPEDGGSFEKVLARLTVDANGKRGDEPGFDKDSVVRYGLATNDAGGDNHGQSQWSAFTGSNGWSYTDKNPWGEHYNYDRKRFQETIDWYFGLAEKGFMAPLEDYSQTNFPEVQVGSGKAAMATEGSWKLSAFSGLKGVDLGIAPTPKGPTGERASMMGGLADSIPKGAKNKKGAAKWVAFLASAECQNIVGKDATVFPATPEGTEKAVATHRENGLDVTPFTRHIEDGTTFSFPVTDHAADINAIMLPAMQEVYAGDAPASSLTTTNKQVNFLFQQDD